MRSLLMLVLMLLVAILLTACASNKMAQPINVVIMVQDVGENSLPRYHQAVKRLINQVSAKLIAQGFNIYDETAITLDDFTIEAAKTKAELIDIARATRSVTLDYVVVLSVDAVVKKTNYSQKISTAVYGQIMTLHSGNVAGSFTVTGARLNARNDCAVYCLNNKISASLRVVFDNVATEILTALPTVSASSAPRNESKRNNSKTTFDTEGW